MEKVWRNDKSGLLFHDSCFDEDETRDGYTEVDQDELYPSDDCESCGGSVFGDEEGEDSDDDDEGVSEDES